MKNTTRKNVLVHAVVIAAAIFVVGTSQPPQATVPKPETNPTGAEEPGCRPFNDKPDRETEKD